MAIRAKSRLLIVVGLLFVLISMKATSAIESFQIPQNIYFPLISYLMPVPINLETRLVISEVMINPSGSEPENEWFEVFNRSWKDIDLQKHKIGDGEIRGDTEGMYSFPQGASIPAGKTIVIANQATSFFLKYGFNPDFELFDSDPDVKNLSKYRSWSGGSVNLSNGGDELLLLNQDDEMLDAVSWGDSSAAFNPSVSRSRDGESIERIPANFDSNRAEDWLLQEEPEPGKVKLDMPFIPGATPSSTPQSCDNNKILISEVYYDPDVVPEPLGEWIELYNFGITEVDLRCILIGDEETRGGGEGMLAFPLGHKIDPNNVVVIAHQAKLFNDNFGFLPNFEISDSIEKVPDMNTNHDWSTGQVNLNNSGDELILLSIKESILDEVSWGDSSFAFTPPVSNVSPGHSISRQPADLDTDSAADWIDLPDPNPGLVLLSPVSPTETPTPTMTQTPDLLPLDTPTPTPTFTPTPTATETEETTIEFVINEILADPGQVSGDANNDGLVDDSDDEFVEFVNSSMYDLDLSGWSFGDAVEVRHVFPEGSIVKSNCSLVLFGGGTPSGEFGNALVQISSSGKLGLNNSTESIFLYDHDQNIFSSLSYGEEAQDDQSITRDPDILGTLPMRKHTLAAGSGGALFSPGTLINGANFTGCSNDEGD